MSRLERELSELVGNLAAADRVIGEASAAAEAEARAEAVAQAQQLAEEEQALWADTVKAWKAVTASYEKLHAHKLAVAGTRPSAYLDGEPPFVVSPTPVTFAAFVSMLAAAGQPGGFEARIVDSGEVLRRLVPVLPARRAELSGDINTRREPLTP